MITVNVYEGQDELVTSKQFDSLTAALAWIQKMGITGVHYKISG